MFGKEILNFATINSDQWINSHNRTGIFTILIVFAAILIILLIGLAKVFSKAGKPSWAVIIPFYNGWVLAEVAGYPGWMGLIYIATIIPFLGYIIDIVVNALFSFSLAKKFHKDVGMAVVLFLFPYIGYMVLGFGPAKYDKNLNTNLLDRKQ